MTSMTIPISTIANIAKEPVASQGKMIASWFKNMSDEAKAFFLAHPTLRTLALAAGAEILGIPRNGHIKQLKAGRNTLQERMQLWSELISRQTTDESKVKVVMELAKKINARVDEIAFIRKGISVVTYGFLIPSSRAYHGAWAAIPATSWVEDETRTQIPSIEEIKSSHVARTTLINKEITKQARSLRAVHSLSTAVVWAHKGRPGSSSNDTESGSDDEKSDDENSGGSPAADPKPELETDVPELQLKLCKAVVARMENNPMLKRVNSDAAKNGPSPVLMTNYKRSMTLGWSNCKLDELVAIIAAGMQGLEPLNLEEDGLGPLVHFIEEGAADKAATAELLMKDTTVDMSSKTIELQKVTAYRMGALAVVHAAASERLDVNGLTGVPRSMALSNAEFATRVKDELSSVKCGEITSEFFFLKDTNKRLVAAVAEHEEISKRRKDENDLLSAALTHYKLEAEELRKQLQSKASNSDSEGSVDTSSASE